ncbi:hypothetical protein CFter6_4449 [Collimonas fungivorans]|uniref:Uncharacterized protein n=1 Tax=Collimonas fungivorans TaxID=158899 RepID=A0A127PGW3_9BURK|nr:hypothetical protein [Collimonas fungivorans]AMO97042.1 hypothetical protein CFter6_4449 [Collimonas fungivorans]
MRACWKTLAASLCAALTIAAVAAADAAEIAFSSQRDFTEISLTIKDTYNANPDSVALEITLSQDAQQRMAAASGAALEQDLTVVIDGKAVSTSHVQSVVDTPQLRVAMSRQAAMDLLPALLGMNAAANPQGGPAAPVVLAAPTPVDAHPPLLAAAPYVVQAQEVTPPSVSESPAEAAPMPAPAAQEAALAAGVPPDLATPPAADPAPVEAVPALPLPPPPLPPPAIPSWALGAWLPTSATASPYADINQGDPVAVYANAVDAINCNRARLSILDSSNARVRLQVAPDSQCVISGVPVDRLQLSPALEPGKIAISLYTRQDDMNGPPSKESIYRRR